MSTERRLDPHVRQFVPDADRPARTADLHEVVVAAVVESWADVDRPLR